MRWAGHVVRMNEDRLPKIALYGQLSSAVRPMGRPLLRYRDKLKANISTLGITNWETVAKDWTKWRSTCHKAVADFEKKRLESMVINRMNRKRPERSTINTDFVCDTCDKRCKSNAGLSAHKRSHANTSRPIEPQQTRTCRICSKVCKSSRGLKLHLRVHRWAVNCSLITHLIILLHYPLSTFAFIALCLGFIFIALYLGFVFIALYLYLHVYCSIPSLFVCTFCFNCNHILLSSNQKY